MKTVYIFVTTDRPDQYLNTIIHWLDKGSNEFFLVQVEDIKNQTNTIQLKKLRTNIYDLLKMLESGYYKYYSGELKGELICLKKNNEYEEDELERIKIQYKLWYDRIMSDEVICMIKAIPYFELREYISSIYKNNRNLVIDVTSVSKAYIGDILACCLLENIHYLGAIELSKKPDFDHPWRMLIHDLKNQNKYQYINLVETPIFKESAKSIIIRTIPISISIIGTALFILITLGATFFFGINSLFPQIVSLIAGVLGIISFLLIYFPIRDK